MILDINHTGLHDAAADMNMTPEQFATWAIYAAVETHRRRSAWLDDLRTLIDNADTGIMPGEQ
jgi:hypothetical protein